jgi:hypothetical protein
MINSIYLKLNKKLSAELHIGLLLLLDQTAGRHYVKIKNQKSKCNSKIKNKLKAS